jgi:hypothetical protein
MEDRIMYRNEWYDVIEYNDDSLILADNLGFEFEVEDRELQAPPIGGINV